MPKDVFAEEGKRGSWKAAFIWALAGALVITAGLVYLNHYIQERDARAAEDSYIRQMELIATHIQSPMNDFHDLLVAYQQGEIGVEWLSSFELCASSIKTSLQMFQTITPPDSFSSVHSYFMSGMEKLKEGVDYAIAGITDEDVAQIDLASLSFIDSMEDVEYSSKLKNEILQQRD